MLLVAAQPGVALLFLELGGIILGLGVVARLADRFGLSPVPIYLVSGLAFGEGGVLALDLSEDFIAQTADIGVVLLLLTLGLEYTAEELRHGLRNGLRAGAVDLVANATPGFAVGLLMGWSPTASALLAGITYISSSGIIAKVLADLGRLGNRETPAVLTVLVMEDLVMAGYLPVIGVLLAGAGLVAGIWSVAAALLAAAVIFFVAVRFGPRLSTLVSSRSDEALLLTVLGLTLVVAGIAEAVRVSAAVGAFLVGIALSGPVQRRAATLIVPLRDLFAATFFLLFSLRIDPGGLPAALPTAVALGVVTSATKVLTGWVAASRLAVAGPGRLRAGLTLIARGEFSIVIAGLGVGAGVEPRLGTFVAAYVLVLAVAGPLLTRVSDPIGTTVLRRPRSRAE